tara:strand:- start:7562 stop:7882 length:321 start_codon:yes stop_codon:yes gene_type:complete
MDSINVNQLEELKQKIELLSKFHQIEILKILSKNLCKLNENKNGIFVNMSFLPNEVIQDLDKYMNYIEEQSETFQTLEYQKEEFKNIISEQEQNQLEDIISYNTTK